MEFDLVVNDETIERCFLVYDEVGYGYDEDENGNYINFAEATVLKVTWYKDDDDCDVDDIVTVRVAEVYNSPSCKVIVEWHDESFKTDINAVRLLNEAKSDLISEFENK
ncbi:hypothetical protein ACE38V_18170 [Cytobacillus sp. Hz8]|uniref:hypothetical protein n=1 Tax=Cytobacillus sp. Hz8 TaxID=3347168 RepID=UPI0035E24AFF